MLRRWGQYKRESRRVVQTRWRTAPPGQELQQSLVFRVEEPQHRCRLLPLMSNKDCSCMRLGYLTFGQWELGEVGEDGLDTVI